MYIHTFTYISNESFNFKKLIYKINLKNCEFDFYHNVCAERSASLVPHLTSAWVHTFCSAHYSTL